MNYNEIKTFEDACNKLGYDSNIPNFEGMPENYQKPLIAHYKLCIIAEALNEGWKPDWNDWDQLKYYPWFEMGSPSGSGFSYGDFVCWFAASYAGSRLCFKSRELAVYAGKQFEQLYKEYFVLN